MTIHFYYKYEFVHFMQYADFFPKRMLKKIITKAEAQTYKLILL